MLMRLTLRQGLLHQHMANHTKKRFGLTNHRIIVLGVEFRYVVTGI